MDEVYGDEENLNINGVVYYCRCFIDSILFSPKHAYDVQVLMKALKDRGINHQIDFDPESGSYTAHIWLESADVDDEEDIEYSYENECPFFAISMVTALMTRYALEEE